MSLRLVIALCTTFATSALGHGLVQGIRIDGQYITGYLMDFYYMKKNGKTPPPTPAWSIENLDLGFVAPSEYDKPDIVCGKNAAPANTSVPVAAGGSIDFLWTKWPHMGPIMLHVAEVQGDFGSVDKTALKFVKIDEAGFDVATQKWPTDRMTANNNTWTSPVPRDLAPGRYVFRHETIAVHGSRDKNGAQNYPQCFNIEVTGSGTRRIDADAVPATKLYKPDDPGVLFNPYQKLESYTMPGGPLWGGADGTKAVEAGPAVQQGDKGSEKKSPLPSPSPGGNSPSPSRTASGGAPVAANGPGPNNGRNGSASTNESRNGPASDKGSNGPASTNGSNGTPRGSCSAGPDGGNNGPAPPTTTNGAGAAARNPSPRQARKRVRRSSVPR